MQAGRGFTNTPFPSLSQLTGSWLNEGKNTMVNSSILWKMLSSAQRRLKAKKAALESQPNGLYVTYDGLAIPRGELLMFIVEDRREVERASDRLQHYHYNA